jgi:hypothetical protein
MQHVFIPSTLNIYFIHLIYSFALKYINLIELFPVAQDFDVTFIFRYQLLMIM